VFGQPSFMPMSALLSAHFACSSALRSCTTGTTTRTNYDNLSPLMDILFGTYHCPDHEPEHFVLKEPTPGTYLGHLVKPLLPRRPQAAREREEATARAAAAK